MPPASLHMSLPKSLLLVFLSALSVLFAVGIHADAESPDGQLSDTTRTLQFNRDIRPLLSDRCFQCHGPDEKKRESGLRFDIAESATQDMGGYQAIKPGDAEASELVARITADDPDTKMPPPESGKSLNANEIEILKRWIDQGAPFEEHWSFAPIVKPTIPQAPHGEWAINEIDHFISRALKQHSLDPSPAADRATLIKRLSLDLTGLLPTPGDVDAFVNDSDPDAYERLVDRLLSSQHFGERFARHWLDLARYADSNGYANDGVRSIWPYRDWVIKSLNADMPFDQFTLEQLAGDLMPDPTIDQLVATGFHRNTPHQTEGGSDPEQYRVERTKNRTDTTGAVWFGLTVGCAQCHTHKFDPLTHSEYYQLYAFFNDADERTISVTPPEPSEESKQVAAELAQIQVLIDAEKSKQATQESDSTQTADSGQWQDLELVHFESTGGSTLTQLEDGSILAGGANPSIDTYVIRAKLSQPARYIQLETLTHPSLPGKGPGRAGNGNFVLADLQFSVDGNRVAIGRAFADHEQAGHPIENSYNGNTTDGWAINVSGGSIHHDRHAYFEFEQPVVGEMEIRLRTYDQGNGYNIGRMKWSQGSDPTLFPEPDSELARLQAKQEKLQKRQKALQDAVPKTLVMAGRSKPRHSYIQLRGDFLDPGADVQPAPPSVLHPWTAPEERPANRLDLAHWINDRANPLTARVQVNRMWQHMFGMGLVETENDFGYQGSLPSHPELLDYLATELMDGGWRLKRIYKLIAMSATYRQSSHYRADALAVDPKNALLSHQRRYRVEAEIVRDLALCASGKWSPTIGGPSVFPPIPPGVIGTSSANHTWPESKGEDRYRRGLYTTIYRANVYPMLVTFDGPDRDNACTRRSRSNTPLQAMTMANDASLMELCASMAERIRKQTDDFASRVELAFKLALCRPPTKEESRRVAEFYTERVSYYESHPDDAKALIGQQDSNTVDAAAWAATARVLLNLDEFITRE
ncbi:PSD1 and planctomycete cytochrome C domain-containing protein [Stieleria varia]|uniref:Planctomycete cytochrome C n=1 Tax=Stieleria varia TaxID=2528005 RepID=A0A5C5ZZQ0_9BACT|nr:PSD1 and planctomycete cytochrome C domain-containing protein [Stieleria varia]TWT92428.1 Planctomycete cytochrome C [Stieleria varia]